MLSSAMKGPKPAKPLVSVCRREGAGEERDAMELREYMHDLPTTQDSMAMLFCRQSARVY